MRRTIIALVLVALAVLTLLWWRGMLRPLPGQTAAASRAAAASFAEKLEALSRNPRPGRVTEFSEPEMNAWLAHDLSPHYPKGLQEVQIQLRQGTVSATARVNFDEMEKKGKSNPLVAALMRGEHQLQVEGKLVTKAGTGTYELDAVWLDQTQLPKSLVDLLLERYVFPKYPAARPGTPFSLPFNIDHVQIRPGKLAVVQR